jgi:phospholipid/cholesterol/gamma-HCH transport system substrate-binding protein
MSNTKRMILTAAAAIVVVVIAVAAVVAGKAAYRHVAPSVAMCAELTDTIGLYIGNNVSLLGIDIGAVDAITPVGDRMRVNFHIDSDIDVPAEVGAVTIASSIVTDRRLELTQAYTDGPKYDTSQCIPLERTRTPKGISEAFDAIDTLAADLLGGHGEQTADPQSAAVLGETVDTAAQVLKGTGPQFNQAIKQASAMIGDPVARDAVMRRMIDNVDSLTTMFVTNFADFQATLDNITQTMKTVEGFAREFATAVDIAVDFLPVLVRNFRKYENQVFGLLDQAVPIVHSILSRAGDIKDILEQLPKVTGGLSALLNPAVGAAQITYRPPTLLSLLLGSAGSR